MTDAIEAAARAMRDNEGNLFVCDPALTWEDTSEPVREVWRARAKAALAAADAARLKDAVYIIPVAHRYLFTDPLSGRPVWNIGHPGEWNGQKPAAVEPLYGPDAAALITTQAARIEALEKALKELLEANEADCGTPEICYEDDETVGASRRGDGTIEPMAMTFGMLRRARATLEGK